MTRRSQRYPPELRERAVRMVAEVTPNYDSQRAARHDGRGTAVLTSVRGPRRRPGFPDPPAAAGR